MQERLRQLKYSSVVKKNEQVILKQYEKLAHKVAHKVQKKMGFKYDYEDLFQYALLGILQAIRTFDSSKKVKFLTHAHNYAEFSVSHYIRADTGQIKIPYTKIIQKETALPLFCELEDTNLPKPDMPSTFKDIELKTILFKYINKLPEKQKDIFLLTFRDENTADQIAKKYNITRQAVNIQAKKAAKALQIMMLEDNIDSQTIRG